MTKPTHYGWRTKTGEIAKNTCARGPNALVTLDRRYVTCKHCLGDAPSGGRVARADPRAARLTPASGRLR